jgi:diguanylate cyclase (GGDEF)-like protein
MLGGARTHSSRMLGPDRGRRARAARVVALVVALGLIPLIAGTLALDRQTLRHERTRLDASLANVADAERAALEAYFARARAVILVAAQNPSFRSAYRAADADPRSLATAPARYDGANEALAYLERLYPTSIGEACFIDRRGHEIARAVRGVRAPSDDLSPDETGAPFFAPGFRQRVGQVYQTAPYVSPDTDDWVIANATPIAGLRGGAGAIVHFEVAVESFRRAAAAVGRGRFDITVVDGRTGRVVFDADEPQRIGARLGRPGDRRFEGLARRTVAAGTLDLDGRRGVYRRLHRARGNANDWYVVATAAPPAGTGAAALLSGPVLGLMGVLVVIGLVVARHWLRRGDEAASDPLTGLPNRRLFNDRLEQALATARREGHPLTVMLIDLDRFKEINDALGHHFGDVLLRQVSTRLREALRESDTVARLGGDEFAILLPRGGDTGDSERVAEKIRAAIGAPLTLKDGLTLEVEASVGIARFPEHGREPHELLRCADVAMYVAKAARSGQVVYATDQDEGNIERLSLVAELRRALDQEELVVQYQPKVELTSGAVSGVEALVRWRHPERGLLGPDQFIPMAERTSLIKPLTLFVLERALTDCRGWQDEGIAMSVSVNLSANHLMDTDLPVDVAALVTASGLDPGRLELEITETALMFDPGRALEVLDGLSRLGVKLSIDDFGVGYSSLNYLKRLPVDVLKIDRSFVMNMEASGEDAMIVRSTIDLARNLGLRTVAEGVESTVTLESLRELGCDLAQGFVFSRPVPADALLEWARAHRAVADPTLV